MKLKGKKIYLQKGLTEEDYPLLLKWLHDVEIMRYVSWIKKGLALKNIPELKNFIARLEGGVIFGIYGYDNKFIGYASLSDFIGKEECEFSVFILDKNYWGKMIGIEITNLMLDYAFRQLKINKIVLFTSEFHTNAIKLYEKAGFKKTELIPNDRTIFHDNRWILSGTVKMAITRSKFETQ